MLFLSWFSCEYKGNQSSFSSSFAQVTCVLKKSNILLISCLFGLLLKTEMERFTILCLRQMANGRNDHATMFIQYLLLAVLSFSVELSSFGL